ncbi:MAG TPA: BON domain-containing protein [Candidatus Hydrogenedentes bacterium]|nr:BON domain-containing protein [Candidatus Hydrogenedentota bacterium]HOL77227.1 BON domain-containing protein [Candidatus Hydrogenedentota bacterium]
MLYFYRGRCSAWLIVFPVICPFLAWGNQVEDSTITAQIEGRFLLDKSLSPFDINTTTQNGVVTLSGAVGDDQAKQRAEEIARGVSGVKEVRNQLVIVDQPQRKPAKRSLKELLSDRALTAVIRSRLLYHKRFQELRLDITCRKGVVTLYGVVSSEGERDAIQRVVEETRGVVSVNNKLTVSPGTSERFPQKMLHTVSDAWVEKRVEAALGMNRYVALRNLNVTVQNGICFLSGNVGSEAEKSAAEAVAASVVGVVAVENSIEVLPQSQAAPTPQSPMEPISPSDE